MSEHPKRRDEEENGSRRSSRTAEGRDPARSLALLWRTSERANRIDLTIDGIVATAVSIADEQGLSAVTMRRVAQGLGVGTMSLYTHIPGKSELVDLMIDTVHGESPRPHLHHATWRQRLRGIAQHDWRTYQRHPWMLHATPGRPVLGPNLIAKYDDELSAVDGLGLTDVEMDATISLVAGYVEGTARRAVEDSHTRQRSGMTDEQWWNANEAILSTLIDADQYPTASRVGTAVGVAHQTPYSPEHAFEFGLERILDGIQALIDARRKGD